MIIKALNLFELLTRLPQGNHFFKPTCFIHEVKAFSFLFLLLKLVSNFNGLHEVFLPYCVLKSPFQSQNLISYFEKNFHISADRINLFIIFKIICLQPLSLDILQCVSCIFIYWSIVQISVFIEIPIQTFLNEWHPHFQQNSINFVSHLSSQYGLLVVNKIVLKRYLLSINLYNTKSNLT